MNESANPTLLFEIVFRHEITVSDNAILLEGQTLVFTKRTQIRVRAEVVSIASQSGRAPKYWVIIRLSYSLPSPMRSRRSIPSNGGSISITGSINEPGRQHLGSSFHFCAYILPNL